MRFSIEFQGFCEGPDGSPAPNLGGHIDAVMEELVGSGANDPAIGANSSDGSVEIVVVVEADSLEDALQQGSAIIRSAIHAAGGATPEWSIDWVSATGRKAELTGV